VIAVDVGYGQLAWSLRTDERVTVLDRTNVRELTPEAIGGPVDLVVGDLSFISLRLVLPALTACVAPDGDLVMMVKPSVRGRPGAARLGRRGARHGRSTPRPSGRGGRGGGLGLGVRGVTASPLPGPAGNVEYFLWLRADAPLLDPEDVERAIKEGPPGTARPRADRTG